MATQVKTYVTSTSFRQFYFSNQKKLSGSYFFILLLFFLASLLSRPSWSSWSSIRHSCGFHRFPQVCRGLCSCRRVDVILVVVFSRILSMYLSCLVKMSSWSPPSLLNSSCLWLCCPRGRSRSCLRDVDCGRSRADGSARVVMRPWSWSSQSWGAIVVAVVVIAPVVDRSPQSQWSTQWSICGRHFDGIRLLLQLKSNVWGYVITSQCKTSVRRGNSCLQNFL